MFIHQFRRLLVLGAVVGFGAVAVGIATAVAPQPPPLPPTIDERALLPLLPSEETMESMENTILSPETTAWSKGVFQSFRDDNWEIYRFDYNAPYAVRLTSHPASDTHPRLNRGATRIAFSSNRDGDYEIFVMNADGSGVQQLTYNDTPDVNPVWSPNSRQIAFQSYRDGQAEIYTMNADGSNQQRLTAHSSFDGEPAWSPDGQKIAFTSSRTGVPYVYVMNSNSTGVTKLSNQPSAYPAWSPSGNQIAYSADLDGDGFLELWLMDVDGSNQRMVFDPYGQTDAWARGWTPDGRSILFTKITFIFYQGTWYWQFASIYAYDTVRDDNSTYILDYNSLNWHPDWQTTDAKPPQTAIGPISPYSQIPGFQVSWSGTDLDNGSGLATYDAQLRLTPTGLWVNWQTGITMTLVTYPAEPGTTVSFRVRGRDHAFNYEPWPTFNNPTTTFYTWAMHGKLTDNRGAPISNAPLSIIPPPVNDAQTDQAGLFISRLKTAGSHTLDVIRTGYGDMVQTTLNMENLAHLYLPPANDIVLNGSFEATSPLANWTTSGEVTAVTQPRHTGTKSTLLAGPTCLFPCLIEGEELARNIDYAAMATDSQGNLYVVSSFVPDDALAVVSRSPSGNWFAPQLISSQGRGMPKLVIDHEDTLHVLWSSGRGLYYTYKSADDPSWSTPETVFSLDPSDTNFPYAKNMAVDSRGGIHVLLEIAPVHLSPISPYISIYFYRQPDGAWQDPILLYYGAYSGGLMAIGPDDVLHFIWTERRYTTLAVNTMYYQTRSADGAWSHKQSLPIMDNGYAPLLEDVAVSREGAVHVMWSRRETTSYELVNYHQMRSPSGLWSTPALMLQRSTDTSYIPGKIAVDSNGSVYAILMDTQLNNDVLSYAFSQTGSGWQLEPIASNSPIGTELLLMVDRHDIVHILANDYRRSLPADSSSVASLSQTVTIPADMAAPTLAFMAKRPGDVPNNDSGLDLLVHDGVTETAVPLPNGSADWTHYWADMSPWAGQTVTVTFRMTQVEGDPRVQTALDDVTLGSAYPDAWVRGIGPGWALPGETVTFQIQYGNQSGVTAADGELVLTWPESLALVSASITPTVGTGTLTWDVGDLAAGAAPVTLVVTATVDASTAMWKTIDLPLSLTSSSVEIEQENNEAIISMVIAHRTFFPMLFRP